VAVTAAAGFEGQNLHDSTQIAELLQVVTAPALFLGLVAGGVAMLLVSPSFIGMDLADTSSTGAAWVPGSRKNLAEGLIFGAVLGLCSWIVTWVCARRMNEITLGPLARLAITPGLSRWVWIMMVLLLAPPFEELLFRGVLYGGYRRSLGPAWAAVFTTAIFVTLHAAELIHFLPSIFGVTALAVTTLWLRLRSSAIGPAVAAHFGYNTVLTLFVFL